MNWLYDIGIVVALVAVAFIFGWAEKTKRTGVQWVLMIGVLILVLWMEGLLGKVVLLVIFGLDALDHIPKWIGLMLGAVIVGFYFRFVIGVFAQSLDDIAQEQQRMNARIKLMESSITHKLNDIASRFPKSEDRSE